MSNSVEPKDSTTPMNENISSSDIHDDVNSNNSLPQQVDPESPGAKKSPHFKLSWYLVFALVILVGWMYRDQVLNWFPQNDNANRESQSRQLIEKLTASEFAPYILDNTTYTAQVPFTQIRIPNLRNFEQMKQELEFNQRQVEALETDNFFIVPNTMTDFYDDDLEATVQRKDDWPPIYSKLQGSNRPALRKLEDSVFVSTDYLLHVYHRLFQKQLEYIEVSKFQPMLHQISSEMYQHVAEKAKISSADQANYTRVQEYFAVALALLQPGVTDSQEKSFVNDDVDTLEASLAVLDALQPPLTSSSNDKVREELELIYSATEMKGSPIFNEVMIQANIHSPTDYTQFTARGNYTKTHVLRSYFRAMMWFGRTNFYLKSPDLTKDALIITQIAAQNPETLQSWITLHETIGFLVGPTDDLTLVETSSVAQGLSSFSNEEIEKAQLELLPMKKPRVMSSIQVREDIGTISKQDLQESTQGFFFFGQRYTPDAYVFTEVTQGEEAADPETGEKLPSMPTALLAIKSIIPSPKNPANELSTAWIDQNHPDRKNVLTNRLSRLNSEFSEYTQNDWTRHMYTTWIYTLHTMFPEQNTSEGYPHFYSTAGWGFKSLQTVLGSWTELKHDTVLYAKQSYAELGGGGEPEELPEVPKGYVEPNIEFFDRLIAMINMTQTGLKNNGIEDGYFESRTQTFLEELEFYRSFAVKQLQNEVISDEEFEKLRTRPDKLEVILYPLPFQELIERNARSAIVTDVFTDTLTREILYEANSVPDLVYVAVSDINGTRLTRGLVYAYHEFTGPLSNRLNNEEWYKSVYVDNRQEVLPPKPSWITPYVIE